jgi:hypothetical protein
LYLVLEMATETLGFDAATATARRDDELPKTVAATVQRFESLDEAQYASGEGPCLSVLTKATRSLGRCGPVVVAACPHR